MSPQLIARSADLARLRNEGYTIRIVGGHLVVDDIPFVDDEGAVQLNGVLVMALTTAGNETAQPSDHTAWFCGGIPSHTDGQPLTKVINNTRVHDLGNGLTASCYLSAKPRANGGRYDDYHHKVTTYIGHITGPAQAVDRSATARRHLPVATDNDYAGPFRFVDTASSRAGIEALNDVLADERVGIVGLGGSGEYIFDGVAKAPVPEIHIFDGDEFLTHNLFRAPGAPTQVELEARPLKVDHFADLYERIRHGIHRHPFEITSENVGLLADLTFVFLAIDDAEAKAPIVEFLVDAKIPFIDVGMGLEVVDQRIIGTLRTTLVTPSRDQHAGHRIPTISVRRDEDAYRSNIQTVELNMMNGAQAIITWKRYRGFYADWDRPHHSLYSIASNRIANDEYDVDSEETEGEAA